MRSVVICGSRRFKPEMRKFAKGFKELGVVVYEPSGLSVGSFDGKTGTFQAKGYLYTEEVSDGFCQENCTMYQRAFFYISETPNENVATFITKLEGNAFVAKSAVALGCVMDGRVTAVGTPNSKRTEKRSLSKELSEALINSSKSNPVSVQIERILEPNGGGADTCYSHFDNVILL